MSHSLPQLPYQLSGLEPVISQKTMEFHHGKHHQTYINNLNNLIVGTKFENMNLEQIVLESDGAIYNNSAQVWNHTFFFVALNGKKETTPSSKLLKAIENEFGTYQDFVEKFSQTALTLFGSGWAWLVKKHDGTLAIVAESNAGNPMKLGLKPILTIDVWEHAYYLDYQNRRGDYIKELWKIIDWDVVSERYEFA